MTESVNLNKPSTKTDFLEVAKAAWGEELPDWVVILAEEATRTSQTAVAKRVGLSNGLVSQVIGRKYPGDASTVEAKVRGGLMGLMVDCPVLGEMQRNHCLDEQKKKFAVTSAMRTRIFHACRNGCPNSRLKGV